MHRLQVLNKWTQKDHFPLPFINTILDEVVGHELYTFMDGYSGYNRISIAPEDHNKTTFITPWGTFIYVVMPFGLCNAPLAFQRAMSFAFLDLLHRSMTIFLDDFSTHSSATEHLYWVKECLIRCRKIGIAVNPDKIYLVGKRGVLLGHIVSQEGTEPGTTDQRDTKFEWTLDYQKGFDELKQQLTTYPVLQPPNWD